MQDLTNAKKIRILGLTCMYMQRRSPENCTKVKIVLAPLPALMGEIFSREFFVHVNDYIEPMAIFTAWAKFYSTKISISVMQGYMQLDWAKFLSIETFQLCGIRFTPQEEFQ